MMAVKMARHHFLSSSSCAMRHASLASSCRVSTLAPFLRRFLTRLLAFSASGLLERSRKRDQSMSADPGKNIPLCLRTGRVVEAT